MLELLILGVALAVFLLFTGMMMPADKKQASTLPATNMPQFRPRSIGRDKMFSSIANAGVKRAMGRNSANATYLRQLKQADWYWMPGEPIMPNPKAPFWNLETLWSEKLFGGIVYGGLAMVVALIVGVFLTLLDQTTLLVAVIAALLAGGLVAFFGYSGPDSAVAGAASKRQRELGLEMGFRIPELRGDVMAGNTIQRAIRNMGGRPGGPFVEELRRAVTTLDITKDDTLAMDQLIERNEGNELVTEFANSLKMVSRQGGQIGPVLNVLADLAQQRLRLNIEAQAKRNLQEMTRPIGLSSMVVTTLLIVMPAIVGVMGNIGH